MTQVRQINKPIKVNRDIDPKYLPNDTAFYMLNFERSINSNGTLGKGTPMPSTELLCEMEESIGQGYWVGAYRSELTNEVYLFRYRTTGVDYVLRINEDSTCQLVYQGDCLFLSAAPEQAITQWRCYLKYDKICAHRQGKQLIWVDGSDTQIGMLDVEASIDTESFTTPFFDLCADPCSYVRMCVPEPCGALVGEFIALDEDEVDLTNHLVDRGIQVRFQHVYYDGRASSWSDISSLYYQDAKGCFDNTDGLPRCLKFRVPIGNPLVDKIRFAFTTNNGQVWYLADTIEKYAAYTSEEQYWYERELADLSNFSDEDCSFDYVFCNDKECEPIDVNETNRVFNPMPRSPQGFFRIKDSLAFYNYIKGNCPLLESETKKVTLSLNCDDENTCNEEYVTIVVRAIIYNTTNRNQFIYRKGGVSGNPYTTDDETDVAYFGGTEVTVLPDQTMNTPFEPNASYDQFFNDTTRGFNIYIEGTSFYAQTEQWRAAAGLTSSTKVGVVSSIGTIALDNRSGFFYQESRIQVKKGTTGFLRINSHKETSGIVEKQNTSTYVAGTIPTLSTYSGGTNINGSINLKREIYFDTCNYAGDELVIDETFVIYDLNTPNDTGTHSSSAFSGYITDNGNKVVSGAEVYFESILRSIADHNGFYFFNLYGNDNDGTNGIITVGVRVELGCAGAFTDVKILTLNGAYSSIVRTDVKITNTDSATYENDFLKIVEVLVRDCDNLPISGLRVAMSGAKYSVTDALGVATFRLRNVSTRNRQIRAVIMNHNYCITLDCDGNCNPCMPKTTLLTLGACFTPVTTVVQTVDGQINRDSIYDGKKGLKAGGRYPFGLVAQGSCGRLSAVYPLTVLDGSLDTGSYLNVPKTQAKGVLSFCDILYDTNNIQLPEWADCLKIVRGQNQNVYQLQWLVDKIERTADNKIKLTLQSLNDYNAKYNFETNTNYEYQKNDRVEFISNGGNEIFDIATYGLLNYQILSPFNDVIESGEANAPANFFNQILIADDGKLENLKEGAKIEIQRPKDCTEENTPYFEIGVSLAVNHLSGATVIIQPTGEFNTFDTYFVNRQIGKFSPQTFEHRNPSDFWGDALQGISDVGKVHYANKFENEKRYGRNITINTQNQFNRFGDFEKILDAPSQGDLTAVSIYDGKIGLGIGEFDSFLFQISDDFLRVGSDGVVRAAPSDALISDTQPKVSGIFGCQYEDIGSVMFGDGFVTWVDGLKSALVKHDFNSAKEVSASKYQTWFRAKVQRKSLLNSLSGNDEDKIRWITGFNTFTNALQISIKALGSPSIYNEKDALLQDYETLLFDPRSEDFLTNVGYVPEAYTSIKLTDAKGCAFISATGNKVWVHPIIPTTYNKFYDVPTDCVIGLIINQNPEKIKVPLSLELQTEQMWYVTKVETDDVNFDSEIPPIRFKKTERKWNASFLFNKNSIGGLYGTSKKVVGASPRGYYIKVTFVRDNTLNLAVNTIDNNKRIAYGEIDMVLSKVFISEQSGFDQNL